MPFYITLIFKTNKFSTIYALFQLDDSAFSSLNVRDDHYENVEELNLSDNKLENLSDKLLKMNLRLSFRAKNNRLTSVSLNHMTCSSDHTPNPEPTNSESFFTKLSFFPNS